MLSLRNAWLVLGACTCILLSRHVTARQPAQDEPAAPNAPVTLQSIAEDYSRQLLLLEKQRLERLAVLASHQPPHQAAGTYELLFRLAITNNRFADAEPIAERLLTTNAPLPPIVHLLARTIDIVGATDRGDYDASLADLKKAIEERAALGKTDGTANSILDTNALLVICDAYFQRLFQAGQFDVAAKAAQLVIDGSKNAALRETCQSHLAQIGMVGKLAPALEGTDIDGRPFNLADARGNPVLLVFWATWCLPNVEEVEWLDYAYNTYKDRGFRIVGINLDTLADRNSKPAAVIPEVRRFLLDNNVRWPNLINGTGARDYAKAYGVNEIPASFLVGRDGKITHLHLSRKNLATAVAQAIAK